MPTRETISITAVSTSRAKASLSSLMNDAANGRRVIIERRGKPLAALVGVDDLEVIERDLPASAHPKGALVLIGAWSELEDGDMDSLVTEIYARRLVDTGREVELET